MKKILIFVVSVLVSLSSARNAAAGEFFAATSASCVPGNNAIQFDRYSIQSGKIFHTASNTDLVTVYCPINIYMIPGLPLFTANHMKITYKDSDGTGEFTSVVAHLIKMDQYGAITVLTTFTSNAYADVGIVQKTHTFPTVIMDPLKHGLVDSFAYTYYVRVDMDRGSTADSALFHGVTVGN
jgi:hypothetical protein